MTRAMADDLDYLAARLHGRRSRLAEAERLDTLCRIRTIPELVPAIYPDAPALTAARFQRRLTQDLALELSGFFGHLTQAGSDLLAWMLVRFQVENMKVLVRGSVNPTPSDVLREHLLVLPDGLAMDTDSLASAESLNALIDRLPVGAPRTSLREVAGLHLDPPRPFLLEAALDRGYFEELLARADRLSGEDKEWIRPLILQEVDLFQLMLVVRGKFHYGLTAESLFPFHVRWGGIPGERFSAMLADPDLPTAGGRTAGRVLDVPPSERKSPSEASAAVEPATLEALAWTRFLRLANRAFRRSHMGLGTVVGYAGIRRVEVANLITLSEGIRIGMAPEAIRARLIPRTDLETVHV
jgi:vacuolar-type H+-ATPase subunit C/Vma6